MLPWASWDREKQQDKYGKKPIDPLDCSWCMDNLTPKERARVGCGWLLEEDRVSGFMGGPEGSPVDDECPGYSMRLPEVFEAARALGWKKDGLLREFYEDGATAPAIDAMDILDSEIRCVERHAMRSATEEAKRGSR